jgi:methylenetetrahydrofolate--tRNA-(uracil-5-)-methyltransferase
MPEHSMRVSVVGGGLAGCEAAWQLAKRGVPVDLFEMRPEKGTEAHTTGNLAELVCSNSLRSQSLATGAGLLKEEMRRMDSLIIDLAMAHRVPAGTALAVDRICFSQGVSERLAAHPLIRVIQEEVRTIPGGLTILASGPLTAQPLARSITSLLGTENLYYYDAISPVVTAESIDLSVAFRASRYDNTGDDHAGDYLNLPLSQDEYYQLVDDIGGAEKVVTRDFERFIVFEGCLPIEEMARRGRETLAFGPLRPTGLSDPRTGGRSYAVVQLRQENTEGTLYNLVGFQTKMTYPEQRRVFSSIPGLANAEFVRYGSLHRNTFINAPQHLLPTLQLRARPHLLFAGQMTGVEGYIESGASGLLAGVNAARLARNLNPVVPPATTALGSLLCYITDPSREVFQPMNVNFGLFPELPGKVRRRRERKKLMMERALADLERWCEDTDEFRGTEFAREA